VVVSERVVHVLTPAVAVVATAEKGVIDEYGVYLNPLVWGEGNVHVLGDRGTVRMELADVKRFDSGVVLLTYLPA
jgi:hypothetical protein